MSRNVERDARLGLERRNRILEAGFRMFAEKGIEMVSLASVSAAANAGAATMYNYYENKVNLVIAISAKYWGECLQESKAFFHLKTIDDYTAYDAIEIYTDEIIRLYREQPMLLKFSSNYKTFICHEGASESSLRVHLDVMKPLTDIFHALYERAKIDHSIRTDIPEKELFTTITMAMLATAERFTLGLVWGSHIDSNYIRELTHIKEMLLLWCKG